MKSKVETILDNYRIKLARKERLIEPFIKRKNESFSCNWCSEVEYVKYKQLEAEINLLKIVISDLEYVIE
ncbi:hypothetical protein NE172_16895 [Clostridium botulinum]|uniref:Uncharacterized protein n=1 Tax=Clostridium botulinum TaxID=1491 RepID=A0A6B4JIB7_CLOBO|nr:hypothetical protein [Clostridium botulinum]EES50268.1 hypothetical protein CLO_0871 [Clostridium botulinum E1 str. 'BoNT E Beluga']MBY6760047.1 hypothetical protein [Clostridium botulinum]MBY6918956.1 hypothetical protein [Clostridium botulinum]MCR1132603.1 hypothetical protein [Clostridium botulinum]NFG58166.1 hypothetical protein [Clostridium botulinum]